MFEMLWSSPVFDGFLGGVLATLLCLVIAAVVWWSVRRCCFVTDGELRTWFAGHYPFFHVPRRTLFYRVTRSEFSRLVRLSKGNPEWLYNRLTYPPTRTLEEALPRQRFTGFVV